MRKWLLGSAALLSGMIGAGGVAWSQDTTTLTFSIWQQPEHYMVRAIRDWAEDVEERAGGKVEIEFYYGGTLTTDAHAFEGIVEGISDLAAAASGWNPGRFPMTRIADIPLGWESSSQASRVIWEAYKEFKPKEWDDVHLLYLFTDAIGNLHTKSPVNALGDVPGTQIRGTASDVPLIEAIGGTAVGMPWGEVYLSLQRGIVEGLISNYASYQAAKLAEVTDYTLEHNIRSANFWVAMNKERWESLDPDVQQAFDEASEAAVDSLGEVLDAAQEEGRQYVIDAGNEIIVPDEAVRAEFDAALSPIRDEWVEEMNSLDIPGEEVLQFVIDAMAEYDG